MSEGFRGRRLALVVAVGGCGVIALPVVLYFLAYAFLYVVCSLDTCFEIGL